MQDLTFERFKDIVDEVLDTDLLIASHAKAGRGAKRITYNPSEDTYRVFVSKNGRLSIKLETSSKRQAFDSFQSVNL